MIFIDYEYLLDYEYLIASVIIASSSLCCLDVCRCSLVFEETRECVASICSVCTSLCRLFHDAQTSLHPKNLPNVPHPEVVMEVQSEYILVSAMVLQTSNITSQMIYHRGGEPERGMHC